jgi:exodeoxyribonuclease-3
MYSKILPDKVEEMDEDEFNTEGRSIFAYFGKTVLITAYFPNGGQGPHRLEYKLKFYEAFLKKIKKLDKAGYVVIFCGDVNTAHTEIDLARPKENIKNTGFLPIERDWIDKVIKSGFLDVFRFFYPDKKEVYTYWDQKTASRSRNVGWRIDYFFANQKAIKLIKSFVTHTEIMGSDHCPIEIRLKIN